MPALLALALLAGPAAPTLTLDDALAEAAGANADVRLARDQAELSGVDLYASWAGVLPRLDLQASFGHTFTGAQRTAIGFGLPAFVSAASDAESYALGLTLQLPLFDGARNWNGIARARAGARAASRSLDETSLGVAFETTRRFFEVLKAQESLRVLEETVARSEEIVRRSEALFEAGRGGRLDVLTARGNLGADRIAVEQAVARLTQARADLAVVLGRDAGEALEAVAPAGLTGPGLPTGGDPPPDAELLAQARRARPLLAAQAENLRAAELGQSIARGAWFPTVGLQGSYSRQAPALGGDFGVYGDPSHQYGATAQVVVQWNLFDGRQTLADEQRAAVEARRARTRAEQAEQQVSSEIARARSNLVSLRRSAAVAADNLVAAEQGVALARERLDAGAASQLEVRDASLKLTQARLTLVQTRIDGAVARADLSRAVGGAP